MLLAVRHCMGVVVTEAGAAVFVAEGVDPTDAVSVPLFDGVAVGVKVTVGVPVLSAVEVPVAVSVDVRVAVML